MLFKKVLVISFIIPLLTGCATIVSKSSWPFSVDSNPAGAKVVIANKRGVEIFRGKTPTALRLKSGAGFFSKESYTITLSSNGYETKKINVECKLNGWYFGNIIFGGLIGMLIVDPATGAMYKLDSNGIFEDLDKSTTSEIPSLRILSKDQVPKSWEQYLVKVN